MTNTSTTHTGLLVTGSGDDIEIDVELIGGRTLRLSADGSELGAWPVDECHIEEQSAGDGSFRIVVDGDDAVFTPTEPVSFRALIQRLQRTEALSEPDPAPEPDAATDSGDDAADDPVAFLFGSSPPPVSPEPVDFEELAADDVLDTASDHVPSVEEPVPSRPAPFEVPDDDVVIDGGAIDDPSVDLEEIDPAMPVGAHDSAPVVDDAAVDDPFVPKPEPDEVLADEGGIDFTATVEEAEPGAGDGDDPSGRFGGSALDRLSAAIGSITSNELPAGEDEEHYEIGPNNVAVEVLSTQRTLRDHQLKDAVRGKRLKLAVWLVGVAAVVALFAFLTPGAIDFIQNYEGGAEPPPPLPVSETTVPASTTSLVEQADIQEPAPVSTVADGGVETIFDLPASDFVARWDSFAAPVDEVLEFEVNPTLGLFEQQFTPYLSFMGVVEPQGTIEEFALVLDPSGPANYDRVGIQALGIAIATVDPELSPDGRAALLGELGLDVRQPALGGIDGTVESDGVVYTLVYDEATTLLTLTVAPTG